eukprot:COSAG05_NODE_10189_length_578_cov_4.509395_1_plen_60_part_01
MRDGWAVLQPTPNAQPSRSNTADRSGCSTFSTGISMTSAPAAFFSKIQDLRPAEPGQAEK